MKRSSRPAAFSAAAAAAAAAATAATGMAKRRRSGSPDVSPEMDLPGSLAEAAASLRPPCKTCGRTDECARDAARFESPPPPPVVEVAGSAAAERRGVQPVPIIDARSPDAHVRYAEAVRLGTPIVLTGPMMRSLTEFSDGWFAQGKFDGDEFGASCGTAEAPVCRKGYKGDQLESGEKMSVKLFVNTIWPSDPSVYLAQWQFPTHLIEETDDLNFSWRLSSVPESVVGVDFFSLANASFDFLNPYQYIFMGSKQTQSKIHNDLGGFSIFITVLVGSKDVLLMHRDDEHLLYGLSKNYQDMDPERFPLASGARVWRHVVVPGDVLVMPPRTIHQVVNPAPCLSYSRCHLGPAEMSEWLRSHDLGDASQLNHAEVIFNAGNSFLDHRKNHSARHDVEAMECLRNASCVFASRLTMSDEDGARSWLKLHEDLSKNLSTKSKPRILSVPNRQVLVAGDVVTLSPGVAGGPRANRRACITRVVANLAGALVQFKGAFTDYPQELIPISNVRPTNGVNLSKGSSCIVSWGCRGEEFPATMVERLVVNAAQVQFIGLGSEWDQWVRVTDIKTKSNAVKVLLE